MRAPGVLPLAPWAWLALLGRAAGTLDLAPLRQLQSVAVADAAPLRQLEMPPPAVDEAPGLRPLSWEAAGAKAADTIAKMSLGDKHALLQGLGWDGDLRKWFYVGNTAAVPALGIPSLNMQDAASGFRTYWSELVGTVTCWPSLLAMAATWDPNAVESYARAVGKEFKGKGANGILGPSVNVHRVARNGRNFEYLSGEDPYLGSVLAPAYVRGVQSQGVLAVLKHWVFNEQETNRNSENSIVDDKTAWELYYPPFQAAVDAGVAAAMCSYNRVGGQYSCQNEETLQRVLKDQMGFKGFVQTDWWAAKAMGMPAGLDQEMPGSNDVFFNEGDLAGQDPQRVDDAVHRVLSAIYRLKLETSTPCSPPDCEEWFRKNVTSEAHASLARSLATESIVLLKNDKDVLPISTSRVGKIAVLGAASAANAYDPSGGGQNGGGDWATGDYYSGGGSGHMVAGRLITPLQGISSRAASAGIEVASAPTDDVEAGLQAADGADLIIVVAATTSGESRDRDSLALDGGVGDLIGAVSDRSGKPVVVLVQSPGAFVAPWVDSADGVLVMFLGGQETGAAWASILFGDQSPTGRLPLMLPATEDDQIPPGTGDDVEYSEGTKTSYRNHDFKAAFPFGHGLTFTTFEYTHAVAVPCGGQTAAAVVRGPASEEPAGQAVACVQVRVRNAGKSSGQEVVQLYLEFPAEAGRPGPLLKGFQKTGVMAPGDEVEVVLPLTRRDLSYYDAEAKSWKEAASLTAHVGASSADLRASPVQLTRDEDSGEWPAPEPAPTAPAPAPAAALLPAAAPAPRPAEAWPVASEDSVAHVARGAWDCEVGLWHWREAWSAPKRAWCCEHEQKGCDGQPDDEGDDALHDALAELSGAAAGLAADPQAPVGLRGAGSAGGAAGGGAWASPLAAQRLDEVPAVPAARPLAAPAPRWIQALVALQLCASAAFAVLCGLRRRQRHGTVRSEGASSADAGGVVVRRGAAEPLRPRSPPMASGNLSPGVASPLQTEA
ncbi:unnamed protein product [Prorocentrum cordatum]|uniref:Probable beta-glucosidase G n=1 Tax=Prorocentrum cordatum TaxID=2364126 RepID=A0ABN9YHD0_9DINO|nr:unnamed protein product [Polarella glacialis]